MRTEDGRIIQKCLNGEPEAFGILVDKYKEGIYAFVYTKLRNFHDAQDVTQEVFLQAYRGLRSLRRWESFAFWLYRIASARCTMWLRTRSRRVDSELIEDQDDRILVASSMNSYRVEQVNRYVRETLDSLPEACREVLTLHYFAGMSSSEMARVLGTSPAAIRKRLSRARKTLREEMADMMGTAFEEQKLKTGFTFRIVETVRRIKISPTPRTAGLPWGLSLATGIILTVLSINPHLSLPDQTSFPRGSPLPAEMKVLKTGEIPVQVLRISQTLAIASKQGDGDGGELRPDDERGNFLLAPQASEVKLKPRNGAANDVFGNSVRIHSDYAIVGAYWMDDGKGAAYIFKRDGDSWREQEMLSARDGEKGDCFGFETAISDEFAAVGAPYDDDEDEDAGSVYVFRRTGESWTQQAKLTPLGQLIKWSEFGIGVAISGDYLVVGSHCEEGGGGVIYIFKRDGNAWNEQAKLKSSNWNQGDWFGEAVSISGDYVIATAPNNNTGSAYVFKREGDIWKEQAILAAKDGKAGDAFGVSNAISGDHAIVGASWHKDETGAAYIFVREGSSWKQQAKLMPGDLAVGDRFGRSVCISDDYAIASSPRADGKKGAVYGFLRDGNSWKQVSKLTASDGIAGDWFGTAVAFSGNYAIVGASGAAYIYNFADFFPVEPSGSFATTFGGEKDKPALPDVVPPPAKQPVAREFRLLQNFPNPFNPETWLPYELASDANVVICIHNSKGDLVRRLSPGMQETGFYTSRDKAAFWDGRNEAGERVASGTYFYTIQAGEFTATKKMAIAE
jgi:RNA polymerase sigma factor (sigma-70 family)